MFLIVVVLVLVTSYYYLSLTFQYWKKRNVPHPPPSNLFGNIGSSLLLKKSPGQIYADMYNAFPDCLYVGYYKVRTPSLLIRDPQLIRDVLGKNFNHFHDNDFICDKNVDPIGGRNVFSLKGEEWKIIKSQITPCFTQKKVKEMSAFVEDAVKKLMNYIDKEPNANTPDGLESRELFAKYATEVVAACAFGLEGNTFTDPDPIFRKMGKKIFDPTMKTVISVYILKLAPFLSKFLKVRAISQTVSDYFIGLIKETIKYREDNKIIRNDFLGFMIELRSKCLDYEFTDVDITAQAVSFFVDGFETSSAVMSFTFHELASNPEALDTLRNEIDKAFVDGRTDFDSITEMKYLDAVINESLRMHPPGYSLMRMCTKAITLPPPRGSGDELQVEVGTPVIIPIYGLHYNPEYFKDPHAFKPERFLPENKNGIAKGTFLPFGDGGRSCHGQRFALMQIKVLIVHILHNYDIKVGKRTILPLEIDPKYWIPHAKGGLWLNFSKRLFS